MIRRPPRSTLSSSSAASDVYKRQTAAQLQVTFVCGRSKMEKYKKLREIGQGSFGRVALVQEKKGKGRKLVLKEVEVKRMAEGEQEKVTTDSFPTTFFSR